MGIEMSLLKSTIDNQNYRERWEHLCFLNKDKIERGNIVAASGQGSKKVYEQSRKLWKKEGANVNTRAYCKNEQLPLLVSLII